MITNPIIGNDLRLLQGSAFFNKLLSTAVTILLIAGGIIFVFMLILGGIQWIMAGGDSKAVEAASGRLRTALIGIILLFSVYAIVSLVESVFGVSILSINIDSLVLQ